MSLSTTVLEDPVFTIVINVAIVLFGLIGYTFLEYENFPL
jgi:HAE1 family hydrophobic/amphiphilic exporter-1/multidrug efflux pump